MHIVRADEQRAMPWKNGGGITYEVAIFPPDTASLDDFEWRVSMARVETDGPFSHFPGIDRSLAIFAGAGLRLRVDGTDVALGPQSDALVFSGDIPVSAALVAGPIVDMNVMTRRGLWRHRLLRERMTGPLALATRADVTLLIVRSGTIGIGNERLQVRDALVLAAGEHARLASEAAADLYRIELTSDGASADR
jgi:uncharacterized protein